MKIEISKKCEINLLKGTKYEDFKKQNLISKKVALEFLKSKNKKIIKNFIICNSKELNLASTILKIEFLQCKKCKHVFAKHKYSDKFLKNFWKKKGDVINVHSHKNQQEYRSKYLSEPKVNRVLKFLKKKPKKVKWLDLGCGNGEFLLSAKRKGIKVYGFDLNQRDIRYAKKKGINAYQCDFENFYNLATSSGQRFDIASATGYFDMVDNPVDEIKKLNKLLNRGALLMIDLPDFDSVTHEMIKSYPEKSIRHLNACQRSSFTYKSLSYLLKKNGFKIIFRWHYGLDFYMIMNYLNQTNKRIEKSKMIKIMTKRYSDFQKIFDEEKVSDTIFLIAKKI